jgi:hypothetical protein
MPCIDDEDVPSNQGEINALTRDLDEQKKRLDFATRVACNLEKLLTEAQFQELDSETQRWIVKHRKEDVKRRQREETERIQAEKRLAKHRENEQTRKQALAKLTPKERKVLGL